MTLLPLTAVCSVGVEEDSDYYDPVSKGEGGGGKHLVMGDEEDQLAELYCTFFFFFQVNIDRAHLDLK